MEKSKIAQFPSLFSLVPSILRLRTATTTTTKIIYKMFVEYFPSEIDWLCWMKNCGPTASSHFFLDNCSFSLRQLLWWWRCKKKNIFPIKGFHHSVRRWKATEKCYVLDLLMLKTLISCRFLSANHEVFWTIDFTNFTTFCCCNCYSRHISVCHVHVKRTLLHYFGIGWV